MKLQREDIHPLQDTCPYFRYLEIIHAPDQCSLAVRGEQTGNAFFAGTDLCGKSGSL